MTHKVIQQGGPHANYRLDLMSVYSSVRSVVSCELKLECTFVGCTLSCSQCDHRFHVASAGGEGDVPKPTGRGISGSSYPVCSPRASFSYE
jgi:hypothetical protein